MALWIGSGRVPITSHVTSIVLTAELVLDSIATRHERAQANTERTRGDKLDAQATVVTIAYWVGYIAERVWKKTIRGTVCKYIAFDTYSAQWSILHVGTMTKTGGDIWTCFLVSGGRR